MKGLDFPIYPTKVAGVTRKYNLADRGERAEYYEAKAGGEIAFLKHYLSENNFIAYMLGKKNSGKGTYTKLFAEVVGGDKVVHVSVGDLVRDVHANWDAYESSVKFEQLKKQYRGYISLEEAVRRLHGRSQENLLPTEFILALLKVHILELQGKTLFLDGLPREMDQVSYSLYFRDVINFRDDPDVFVFIDIPESVIDERIKYRVVCPICHAPRNKKLLVTPKLGFDDVAKEIYLMCDNPDCHNARMVSKEGDELGIGPIKGRLEKDEEIIKMAYSLHGIPQVFLRNAVPVSEVKANFDDYEITPEYILDYDRAKDKVRVTEKPWSFKDDSGVDSVSLLAAPVALAMIKQLATVLGYRSDNQ